MATRPPVTFTGTSPADVSNFIRNQGIDLSLFRRVVVDPTQTRVLDVNRSELRFPGISYGNPLLPVILKEAGASFDPSVLDTPPPTQDQVRDFRVSATYPWAHDRIA
jgi:hypothetical protein